MNNQLNTINSGLTESLQCFFSKILAYCMQKAGGAKKRRREKKGAKRKAGKERREKKGAKRKAGKERREKKIKAQASGFFMKLSEKHVYKCAYKNITI